MAANDCEIFISYRRRDSAIFSQWLGTQLRANFGHGSVFIDTRSIRDAEIWTSEIETSLRQAKVVIVVIGKSWLGLSDEYGRRRIDLEGDWVRREIELSLKDGKKILPLLIEDATLPTSEALPSSLAKLTELQARKIQSDKLEQEISGIANTISRIIKRDVVTTTVQYPVAGALQIDALDDENLRRFAARLPEWRVVTRPHDNGEKTELMRTYVFQSFSDAIHFMNTASRSIDVVDHHPEWTNIWRTLIVRLSTWDIGHKPSMLDVDMAAYLDDLYKSYQKRLTKQDVTEAIR